MTNDYIRREDAIRLAEQGQVQGFPWQFQMLVRLPPADVAPYSVSPDGTLIITVPKGTTVNRVLVEWEGTHCGGLYYAD